jgi:hypothetical protein
MTEPRKTPRTDAAELPWVANTQVACYGPCVKSDFARDLEIETQELAEALGNMLSAYGVFSCGICENAHKLLARHRAKQEAAR